MIFRLTILFVLFVMTFACTSSSNTSNSANNSQNVANSALSPTATKTATPPKNFEADEKLQKQSDALLNLFDKMPQVPVYIKDEPIIKNGSETQKGVGYTICEPNNQPVIYLKKIFYQKANQKQLTNILKHELVHAWFCRQGVKVGHDERWRKKFREVGGFGN